MNAAFSLSESYPPNLNEPIYNLKINQPMAEIKHIQSKPIIQTHYPTRKVIGTKRWIIAERKSKAITTQNYCVEASYHQMINTVKTLYMQPGESYYERDLKTDKQQGLFCMHSFTNANFYWFLVCDLCFNYQIYYAFHKCSYELAIRNQFRAYPLDRQTNERKLEPDFSTYFKTLLTTQSAEFIHIL